MVLEAMMEFGGRWFGNLLDTVCEGSDIWVAYRSGGCSWYCGGRGKTRLSRALIISSRPTGLNPSKDWL